VPDLSVQTFRFAVVGIISNALLYVFYLYLVWVGLEPATAMTVVFAAGTLQTFFLNKNWTFSQRRSGLHCLAKYAIVYIAAYIFNLWILQLLVDRFHYPHQIVQGFTILFIGIFIFLLQRYWVFPTSER